MNQKSKKVLLFVLFLFLGSALQIFGPIGLVNGLYEFFSDIHSDFFYFSYLTLAILVVQWILVYLYFFNGYSKKLIISLSLLMAIGSFALSQVPFDTCESVAIVGGNDTTCDCIGVKKQGLLGSECVGIVKKCYYSGYQWKREIPCK